MVLDLYFASVLIFIAFLAIIIYRDRKNIDVNYILLMRRSKRGIKFIEKIAKYSRFWKIVGTIGVITAFFVTALGFWSLIDLSIKIISGEITGPTGGIVLPSPTATTVVGPGVLLIPFWFWILIIPIILIPHELFHGIIAKAEKVRIKSVGLLLFAIFPGAFVEPDEKQIKKLKVLDKFRIFTAGSFANVLIGLILFNPFLNIGLIPNVIWPTFVSNGLYIDKVNQTSPAFQAGIPDQSILTSIDGQKIQIGYTDYLTRTYLLKYIPDVKKDANVTLTVNGIDYSVRPNLITENGTSKYYIGVILKPIINVNEEFFFGFLIPFLTWLWLFCYGVAIVNILPIYPLDGGLVLQAIAQKITKKHQKLITTVVTIFTLSLLIFSIIGPYIIKVFQFF